MNAPKQHPISLISPAGLKPVSGAKKLVRWHLNALGLLAVLSLAGQIAALALLRVPQADPAIAAQAAAQRTLSQRLVLSALAIQESQTPEQRLAWENDLRDTATLWKQSAQTLPRTDAAVASRLDDAAPAQAAMLTAANSLLAALPPDSSRQKADLTPYLTPLFQNQKPYEDGMEAAAAEYKRAAAEHFTALKMMQAGFGVLMLLAVTGMALAVCRPNHSAVGRTIAALDALEARTVEQETALGEADQQISRMRETLENLETVDTLTGLKNHRAFQEQLDQELGRSLRHGHPLSLMLLDIDRFKSYNDSYSHVEGDQALRLLSDLLRETLRVNDIPARYGGKEFAIIMPDTDMMGAVVLGERLRQAVASADGLQRPLTASIGIATLTPSIFSVAGLIAQADRALCHAKGDGRNRVSHVHRIPAPLEEEELEYARAA